jgi:hypothetical protein
MKQFLKFAERCAKILLLGYIILLEGSLPKYKTLIVDCLATDQPLAEE